jgi:hypothetical protein
MRELCLSKRVVLIVDLASLTCDASNKVVVCGLAVNYASTFYVPTTFSSFGLI